MDHSRLVIDFDSGFFSVEVGTQTFFKQFSFCLFLVGSTNHNSDETNARYDDV